MKSVAELQVISLAAFLVRYVGAQTPAIQPDNSYDQQQQQYSNFNPTIAIVLVILLVALFAMAYCSIYLRQCYEGGPTYAGGFNRGGGGGGALRIWRGTRGLDKRAIEALPIFSYCEVKDHKIGKGALECAVCLNEFEDNNTLSLLPKCDHVFHPECIGAWLEQHVTCPVCRSDLTKPAPEPPPVTGDATESRTVEIEIVVQSDEIQTANGANNSSSSSTNEETSNQSPLSWSGSKSKPSDFAKFRSHTTGHSLVLPGENLDRFTLRLPGGIRKDVVERSMLNRTRSYAAGKAGGDDSGRGGAGFNNQKTEQRTKSYRRAIFERTMSILSPKAPTTEGRDGSGGGGGGGGRATSRMGSLKCLEPKAIEDEEYGHQTGLVSNDAAQLSSRSSLWVGSETTQSQTTT